MENPIFKNIPSLCFTFENTKHKLGIRILGDRMSFHELYEQLCECWENEFENGNDPMSKESECSYSGVMSFFSYEVRHTFMGDRIVKMDGKPVKTWNYETFTLFEKENNRFEVGMEFSWPQILTIMASWWECYRRYNCPANLLPVMREFSENIGQLLAARSKRDYHNIEPFVQGAIYAANPYLMFTMEHIDLQYRQWSKNGSVSLKDLAELMKCSVYGSYQYDSFMAHLKKSARKCNCSIPELRLSGNDDLYDIEL